MMTALTALIQNYVTSEDPSLIYIPQALGIIRDPAYVTQIMRDMAPGWPMLLATIIKFVGWWAPYWVNLVFMMGFVALLLAIMKGGLDEELDAIACTALAVVSVLTAYVLNPHFLLYPFRDLPSVFFVLLTYYLLLKSDRMPAVAVAILALFMGVLIRETALVAIAAFPFLLRRWPAKKSWVSLLLASLFGLFLWGVVGGKSDQMSRYLKVVSGGSGEDSFLTHFFGNVWLILKSYQAQMPYFWLIGLILGLWCGRKQILIWVFLITGVGYVVVYSCYGFHPRYVLTSLLWLTPIMAFGVLSVIKRFVGSVGWWMSIGAAIGFSVLLARAEPWGNRVTRTEVVAFSDMLEAKVVHGEDLRVDPACRVARAAALCYGGALPGRVDDLMSVGVGNSYLQPMSDEARHPNDPRFHSASYEEVFREKFDVRVVPGSEFTLGGLSYRVLESLERQERNVADELEIESRSPSIIWCDLRGEGRVTGATLRNNAGDEVYRWSAVYSSGILPLFLPELNVEPGRFRLELHGEDALPRRTIFSVMDADAMFVFDMRQRRRLSTRGWFGGTLQDFFPAHEFHAGLAPGQGTLVLPIPAGANVMGVYVELLWYNRPRHVGEGALVVATDEGEIHRHLVNTANVQSITRFEVPANQIDSLTLTLSGISKPGYLLYLQRLKFRYLYE